MNQSPADVREFLMEFFSDGELDDLCFDYFPDARRNFTAGMDKGRKVALLLDHCHNHGQYQTLYDALARARPGLWNATYAAAPGATGPRVFISYAHSDAKEFVDRLEADLRRRGFIVWRDLTDMPSDGHELGSEQGYAIGNCDRFVPVVSPAAFERPAVQQEWTYARRRCVAVTAVWRLGDAMPDDFGRHRYFDFRETQADYNYEATLAALADKLRQVAGPGAIRGDWREPPDTAITRRELAQLAGLLRDVPAMSVTGRAAVGAVHALGGVGKTVLAGLFSRDCRTRWHFRDGIYWIEVGRTPNVIDLQLRLGRLLGDVGARAAENYATPQLGHDRLTELLAGKWALIVLDDVWNHAHVKDLIAPADNCRWLITTRKFGLGTALKLSRAQIVPLDYLSDEEGLALIASALGWAGPGVHPERNAHLEIVHELGGHAQAIAVTAALLRPVGEFSPARWLARFREKKERGNPLSELALEGGERERNVERSFEVSYDDLGEGDQRRFRVLGAFAPEGSFGIGAAMAVWGDGETEAEDALARLIDRSLLSRAGEGRYSQHALLRAYALAWLKRAGEEAAARRLHMAYYEGKYSLLKSDRQLLEKRRNEFYIDLGNIREALQWGRESDIFPAVDLVQVVVDNLTELTIPARITSQENSLLSSDSRSENQTAVRVVFLDCKTIAQKTSSWSLAARATRELGELNRSLGNLVEARASYLEALDFYSSANDLLGQATIHNILGDLFKEEGTYRDARIHYESALELLIKMQ